MIDVWFFGGMGLLLSLSVMEETYPALRIFRRVWTVTYLVGCVVLLL